MPPKTRTIDCPQCGKSIVWDAANPFRPFCSERCKMIDLGAWATESYRIPVSDDKDRPDTAPPDETAGRDS